MVDQYGRRTEEEDTILMEDCVVPNEMKASILSGLIRPSNHVVVVPAADVLPLLAMMCQAKMKEKCPGEDLGGRKRRMLTGQLLSVGCLIIVLVCPASALPYYDCSGDG